MRNVRTFATLTLLDKKGEDAIKLRRELLRRGLSGAGSRRQMARRLWPVLAAESMRHRDVCSKSELAKFDDAALKHELARRGVACDAGPHAGLDPSSNANPNPKAGVKALVEKLYPLLTEEHARGER